MWVPIRGGGTGKNKTYIHMFQQFCLKGSFVLSRWILEAVLTCLGKAAAPLPSHPVNFVFIYLQLWKEVYLVKIFLPGFKKEKKYLGVWQDEEEALSVQR